VIPETEVTVSGTIQEVLLRITPKLRNWGLQNLRNRGAECRDLPELG
jgi:hypothetical protein